MTIKEQLDEELSAELSKLSSTPYGAEEYDKVKGTVDMLFNKKIEMDRTESEQLIKQQQLKDEKKDRLVKNVMTAAGIALPLLVTIWGTKVSLKFEEEGTFTTIMGRGFINKLLPKK